MSVTNNRSGSFARRAARGDGAACASVRLRGADRRFETGLKAMPLEATVMAPEASVEPWVYTPPPLLFNLAGWNPDWSKCWMGWNAPVVYG